jgi:hypothetical protein
MREHYWSLTSLFSAATVATIVVLLLGELAPGVFAQTTSVQVFAAVPIRGMFRIRVKIGHR